MLYYNRIDVSEDADVNMSGAYKECIIVTMVQVSNNYLYTEINNIAIFKYSQCQ